jgi:hypothetical protein
MPSVIGVRVRKATRTPLMVMISGVLLVGLYRHHPALSTTTASSSPSPASADAEISAATITGPGDPQNYPGALLAHLAAGAVSPPARAVGLW